MNLDEFVLKTFDQKSDYCMRPAIFCKDGFRMSVQGSRGHYCSPRENVNAFYKMEIGYPSIEEPLISEFAEGDGDKTETVYGYVDTNIIQQVIEKHGGIAVEKTFALYHALPAL